MIEIKGLTKFFGKYPVLKDVTLSVNKGSIYGLIGANGAGKTTLIKHIMGIYKQDEGQVLVKGEHVFENNAVKKHIGYIPDELYHFPMYSIKKMARFYKELYPNWNKERYREMLDIFELDENRKISHLSKGMQKQVAFILSLSTIPEILILDEPIDGLDPLMRKKAWKYVVNDVAERDVTVFVSSHNLKELENICDYVGILNKGQMLIERELDALKSDVHKIQLAFKNNTNEKMTDELDILHHEKRGNVNLLIVRGEQEEILSTINKYNPLVLDILPLTLEEVFIYELGGAGYEIQDIIFR